MLAKVLKHLSLNNHKLKPITHVPLFIYSGSIIILICLILIFPITLHKFDNSVDGYSFFIEYAKLPFLVFSIGMALSVLIWRLHSSHRLAYENELKQKSSNIEIKTNTVLIIDKFIESEECVSPKTNTMFLLSKFARIYPLDTQLFNCETHFLMDLNSFGINCAHVSGKKEFFYEFYDKFGLKREENTLPFYKVVSQFNNILKNTYQLVYGGSPLKQLSEDGYNHIEDLLDEFTSILTSDEAIKVGSLTSWQFIICYEGLKKLSVQNQLFNDSQYYSPIEIVTFVATFTILPSFIQQHRLTNSDSFSIPTSYFVKLNLDSVNNNIVKKCPEKASKLLHVLKQSFRQENTKRPMSI